MTVYSSLFFHKIFCDSEEKGGERDAKNAGIFLDVCLYGRGFIGELWM